MTLFRSNVILFSFYAGPFLTSLSKLFTCYHCPHCSYLLFFHFLPIAYFPFPVQTPPLTHHCSSQCFKYFLLFFIFFVLTALFLSSSLIKAGNKPPPATPGKPKKATTFQEFESITSDAWDVGDDDDELLAMAAQNLNIEVVMETANKVNNRMHWLCPPIPKFGMPPSYRLDVQRYPPHELFEFTFTLMFNPINNMHCRERARCFLGLHIRIGSCTFSGKSFPISSWCIFTTTVLYYLHAI